MQMWPEITWDCQNVTGFNENMVPTRDYGCRAEQAWRSSWVKPKAEKPRLASISKKNPAAKAGSSTMPICWLYEKGECKWGGKLQE